MDNNLKFISETKSKVDSIFLDYKDQIRRIPYLLTPSEEIFFNSLCEFLKDKDYNICPKVRVGDIIQIPNMHWHKDILLPGRPYSIELRIDRLHIDFVLISKRNSDIKFGIELDDPSHDNPVFLPFFREDFFPSLSFWEGIFFIITVYVRTLL